MNDTPIRVTRQNGILQLTAADRTAVRSVHGGFGVAMACCRAMASKLRSGNCLTAAAALACMAGGHLLSGLMDEQIDRQPPHLYPEAVVSRPLFYDA